MNMKPRRCSVRDCNTEKTAGTRFHEKFSDDKIPGVRRVAEKHQVICMDQISEARISEVIAAMNGQGGNPLDRLFEEMDREQHSITDYLFEVEGDSLNEDERDLLISFSTLGWHIIRESLGETRMVTGEELGVRLERNAGLLETREEETGDFDEALMGMLTDDNDQPILMGFLVNMVVDRPAEYGGTIRDESVPVMMLHIKTVIDCLLGTEVQ